MKIWEILFAIGTVLLVAGVYLSGYRAGAFIVAGRSVLLFNLIELCFFIVKAMKREADQL